MTNKKYKSLIMIILSIQLVIALTCQALAADEPGIVDETARMLTMIGCAIKDQWTPGTPTYPGNKDYCLPVVEIGKPCWNTP